MTGIVEIKQCQTESGVRFSEVFINIDGRQWYSRLTYPIPDSEASRLAQLSEFNKRLIHWQHMPNWGSSEYVEKYIWGKGQLPAYPGS